MKFIKRNKTILIQAIVFSILGYYYKHSIFFVFVFLLLLLLPFKKIAEYYTKLVESSLNYLGNIIKSILFTLVFIFVIIPLKLMVRQESDKPQFIDKLNNQDPDRFKKLW